MGYVQKKNMYVDGDGKSYTWVGCYRVVKNSEHMTGIYKDGELITSKPKWSQAIKLAKLLNDAFEVGREYQREINW